MKKLRIISIILFITGILSIGGYFAIQYYNLKNYNLDLEEDTTYEVLDYETEENMDSTDIGDISLYIDIDEQIDDDSSYKTYTLKNGNTVSINYIENDSNDFMNDILTIENDLKKNNINIDVYEFYARNKINNLYHLVSFLRDKTIKSVNILSKTSDIKEAYLIKYLSNKYLNEQKIYIVDSDIKALVNENLQTIEIYDNYDKYVIEFEEKEDLEYIQNLINSIDLN